MTLPRREEIRWHALDTNGNRRLAAQPHLLAREITYSIFVRNIFARICRSVYKAE